MEFIAPCECLLFITFYVVHILGIVDVPNMSYRLYANFGRPFSVGTETSPWIKGAA